MRCFAHTISNSVLGSWYVHASPQIIHQMIERTVVWVARWVVLGCVRDVRWFCGNYS